MIPEDSDLLRRYADDGSEAAFAEFVSRHIDLVYSVALRRLGGNAHQAEDATEAVFTDVARKARACSRHPVVTAWLFKSAHFVASNLQRAERRRRHREQEGFAMQQLLSDSQPTVDWAALRPTLDDAISALDVRDREAVMLRFFHGLEFPAIAARLHLSTDGARARVLRALDRLHGLLARRGITSTATALGAALATRAVTAAPSGLAATVSANALASAASAGAFSLLGATSTFLAAFKVPLLAGATAAIAATLIYRAQASGSESARAAPAKSAHTVVGVADAERAAPRGSTPILAASPATAAEETDPAIVAGDEYLRKNPRVKELLARSLRAHWARYYFPLYVELGFDERTATAFEEILASNGAGSTYHGMLGPGRVTLRPFPKLSTAEREARLRELLGDANYARFRAYDLQANLQAMRVARAAQDSARPLATREIASLVRLLSEANREPRDRAEDPRRFWARLFEAASSVLAPDQFGPLETMRAEEIENWSRRVVAAGQTPADAAAPGRSGAPAISLATHVEQDASDPNIQLLALAAKRAKLAEDYAPFSHAQNLAPELATRVLDLLTRRIEQHEDLDQALRRQGIGRFSTRQEAHAAIESEFGAALAGLLGENGRAQLHEFDRLRPARAFVGQMAGVAAVSGIPFSRHQIDALTAVVAGASTAYVAGGKVTFHDIDWTTVEASAASVLSGQQRQLFEHVDFQRGASRWVPQISRLVFTNITRWGETELWR